MVRQVALAKSALKDLALEKAWQCRGSIPSWIFMLYCVAKRVIRGVEQTKAK